MDTQIPVEDDARPAICSRIEEGLHHTHQVTADNAARATVSSFSSASTVAERRPKNVTKSVTNGETAWKTTIPWRRLNHSQRENTQKAHKMHQKKCASKWKSFHDTLNNASFSTCWIVVCDTYYSIVKEQL